MRPRQIQYDIPTDRVILENMAAEVIKSYTTVVELIKSGAHGSEFLPTLLEVDADGIKLTSPSRGSHQNLHV